MNRIIFQRELGVNVAEIAKALEAWDDDEINNLLDSKKIKILNTLESEQNKITKIEQAKRDVLQDEIATHYNVAIKPIPSYQVLSLRKVVADYYVEAELWQEMSAFIERRGLKTSNETFTIYHDTDYREKDVDIELCVVVDELGDNEAGFNYHRSEAVEIMAYSMVTGPFSNIAGAYRSIADWLGQHNQYKIQGCTRQIVHRGPYNEEDAEKYLVEIQIPLIKS